MDGLGVRPTGLWAFMRPKSEETLTYVCLFSREWKLQPYTVQAQDVCCGPALGQVCQEVGRKQQVVVGYVQVFIM